VVDLEPKLGLRERMRHTTGPMDELETEAAAVTVYDLWLQWRGRRLR
jgi:hypothetical protein